MQATIRYLSPADVLAVQLNLDQAISVVEQSFAEHGKKKTENPPKISVHPQPDAFITAMPAFLQQKDACGMKWVSGVPANMPKGLPAITALIVLNDPSTGLPLAVIDGTWITAIRTVAVSVVAARLLCRKDAGTMSIVGCGLQGRYHAQALTREFPSLSLLKVYDNYSPSIESFKSEIATECPGIPMEVCSSAESAIRETELVVTATGKLLQTAFFAEWVESGALVLPVHTFGWEPSTLVQMDRFVVDDRAQFDGYSHGWYQPLPSKQPDETGEIVAGVAPGRQGPDERIINFNTGLGVHDILMAKAILEKAEEKGLGALLPLEADLKLPGLIL